MIIFIEIVGSGMEAYDWASDVSATCCVLFIDYEQGNGELVLKPIMYSALIKSET